MDVSSQEDAHDTHPSSSFLGWDVRGRRHRGLADRRAGAGRQHRRAGRLAANALGAWGLELEARGKGKAPDIDKELRANMLPGVRIVPAMVIAIEKAQEAGIRYNRQ